MATLREIIPGKPLEVAPYGLLSLVDPSPGDNERWTGGFTYESLACTAEVNLLDVCGGNDPFPVQTPSDAPRNRDFTPFAIEAVDRCSTFGFAARDAEARALAALDACTGKALEHEFWTGALATQNGYDDNRFLASAASEDVTPGGTAVKIKYGLALLERALGDCGCGTRGTIHVTRDVASVLGARDVNGHLETAIGNNVVAGTGYSGEGPDGTAPSTGTWMYATGPVSILLGDKFVSAAERKQNVDTNVNDWVARAQRLAAVTWDGCCAFAVHVDLSLDYA